MTRNFSAATMIAAWYCLDWAALGWSTSLHSGHRASRLSVRAQGIVVKSPEGGFPLLFPLC